MDFERNDEELTASKSDETGEEEEDSPSETESVNQENAHPIYFLPNEMMLKIFEKLDLKSMKTTRLVCNKWNGLGIETLAAASELNLVSFFRDISDITTCKISESLINTISASRVITDLSISYRYGHYNHPSIYMKEPDWDNLLSFCEKFGSLVKGMKNVGIGSFRVPHQNLQSTKNEETQRTILHRILTKLCPQLKSLFLYFYGSMKPENETQSPATTLEFSGLPLKSITVGCCCNVIPNTEWKNFLQNIIGASNLLEQYCHVPMLSKNEFLLDFSTNKMLKKLEINCDIPNLIKMAHQVSSSLEILKLSLSLTSNYELTVQDALMMKKCPDFQVLKKLVFNLHPRQFMLGSKFLAKCPTLKSLEFIQDEREGSIRGMGGMIEFKLLQVTTLNMGRIEIDVQVIEWIKEVFPNLERLEIYYKTDDIPRRHTEFTQVFKKCSELNLKYLKINHVVSNGLLTMAHCFLELECLSLKGMHLLYIVRNERVGCENIKPEEAITIENALLLTSSLSVARVEFCNFTMMATMCIRFTEFIRKHNLPVFFSDIREEDINFIVCDVTVEPYFPSDDESWD